MKLYRTFPAADPLRWHVLVTWMPSENVVVSFVLLLLTAPITYIQLSWFVSYSAVKPAWAKACETSEWHHVELSSSNCPGTQWFWLIRMLKAFELLSELLFLKRICSLFCFFLTTRGSSRKSEATTSPVLTNSGWYHVGACGPTSDVVWGCRRLNDEQKWKQCVASCWLEQRPFRQNWFQGWQKLHLNPSNWFAVTDRLGSGRHSDAAGDPCCRTQKQAKMQLKPCRVLVLTSNINTDWKAWGAFDLFWFLSLIELITDRWGWDYVEMMCKVLEDFMKKEWVQNHFLQYKVETLAGSGWRLLLSNFKALAKAVWPWITRFSQKHNGWVVACNCQTFAWKPR